MTSPTPIEGLKKDFLLGFDLRFTFTAASLHLFDDCNRSLSIDSMEPLHYLHLSSSSTIHKTRLQINFNKKIHCKEKQEKKKNENEWNEKKNDRKLYNNENDIPKRSFIHIHTRTHVHTQSVERGKKRKIKITFRWGMKRKN